MDSDELIDKPFSPGPNADWSGCGKLCLNATTHSTLQSP